MIDPYRENHVPDISGRVVLMVEVPNDVAVAQDSRAGRAVLDPLDWDKAMARGWPRTRACVCARWPGGWWTGSAVRLVAATWMVARDEMTGPWGALDCKPASTHWCGCSTPTW